MAAGKLRLRVQTKVLIPVLACLVLLPLVMVEIVQIHVSRDALRDGRRNLATAEGVFRQLLENRQQELMASFRNALSTPRYTAQLLSLAVQRGSRNAAVTDATIREFLTERMETFGDDCSVMLFAPEDGRDPIGARRESAPAVLDFAQASAAVWQRALKGDAAAASISLAGAAYYVVSTPINDPETERLIGAMAMGVRIGDEALQQLKKLTNTEIMLVSGDQVIGSTLPELDASWLRQWQRASAPVVVKDEHFLALSGSYGRHGSQQGFDYVLLSSFEDSLRMQADLSQMLLWVSLLAVVISAAAVWFFVQRFTQPLRELRDTAEAVGRGDFSRRLEIRSNDECGDLAEAFNRMTANLRGSRAELEKAVETLKNTQAQLVQSEKLSAVGQFVAGVAHELNNPLTAVIGFSDLLSQTATDEKIRPHLELIAKSALRCHKIVQNLLSFARQHAPERKLIQINGTIEEVLEIMAYDLRTSNIKVVREFQDDLPALLADSYQLQQVFVNIIGNARQAIQAFRPDGRIVVRTTNSADGIRIEFIDNGPGIPPENLGRIFDPFFTTKPVGKGTGLGLSLSYGIIQEHGGRITVKSEMGRGATFAIQLPAALETARTRSPEAAVRRPRTGGPSGRKVLVVDDEEWILSLAKELLTADGHVVEVVPGGEQGIEALKRRRFDVVVCDWKMPGLNGMQFYEHLSATDPATAQRVLFMSGDVVNDDFQGFLRRHGRSCIPKPFGIEEFRDAVAGMLKDN